MLSSIKQAIQLIDAGDVAGGRDILEGLLEEDRLNEQDEVQQLKDRLEALHEKYQLLQYVSTSLSFELRTPLAGILGYIELLLQGKFGELNNEQKKHLTKPKRWTQDVLPIISDYMDFHLIVFESLVLNFETVDLDQFLQEDPLENFDLTKPQNLPKIRADQPRLLRTFRYLYDSVLSTWNEAKPSLKIAFNQDAVMFRIAGSEPLYDSETPNPALYYSQSIIELHGGEFQFKNTDEGVEIFFTLPIHPE